MDTTPPIEVNSNSVPAELGALVRYAVTSLGGYVVGKGWIDAELLNIIVGLAMVALPTVYGMWKTRTARKVLVTVASAAPDSVAVVK